MLHANVQGRKLKKGIDAQEIHQKRMEVTIKLRKKNRDEQVMKRRGMIGMANIFDENSCVDDVLSATFIKLTSIDVQDLPRVVEALNSQDPARQLEAVTNIRKLISIEKNPPIREVIDAGVVPQLVTFLACVEQETQFEAAWALTNIASGTVEQAQHLIQHGAIQAFIQLLHSSSAEIKEQAVWGLGNIVGDSPTFRDYVIQSHGVAGLLSVLHNQPSISMIRNVTWSLGNLCCGNPPPNFEQISGVLPILAKLVMMDDVEVIIDATWALSYISDKIEPTNMKIQAVIESGVLPRLVQFLSHPKTSVRVPALRCIGNIVTGDDNQTSAALACNPLPHILGLMNHRKKVIQKDACWVISNITAGNSDQIQRVIDAALIPPLVTMLKEEIFDIKIEAAWAISNATSRANPAQIAFLVESGAIPVLCDLFSCTDPRIITAALQGVENILRVGKRDSLSLYGSAVENCGGLDGLESLQRHDNDEIYCQARRILRECFESEDVEEASLPKVNVVNNRFSFGLASGASPATHSF